MKYVTLSGFFTCGFHFFYKYIIPLGFLFCNSEGVKYYTDNSNWILAVLVKSKNKIVSNK
jgi:hypothetical protein